MDIVEGRARMVFRLPLILGSPISSRPMGPGRVGNHPAAGRNHILGVSCARGRSREAGSRNHPKRCRFPRSRGRTLAGQSHRS